MTWDDHGRSVGLSPHTPRSARAACMRVAMAVVRAIERVRKSLACAVFVAVAVWTAGCNGAHSAAAPTALPPPTAAQPTPAPAPANLTLTGRVTETPPTSSTGVWDATVTLDDGMNSWRSEKTIGGAGRGLYTIPGLHAGRFRATVAADGFVSVTRDVTIQGDNTVDFQLAPVAERKTTTVSDHLSERDGTCNAGGAVKPCHIIALPVHNAGVLDATLTLVNAGRSSVTLTLFESRHAEPFAVSTSVDGAHQRLVADLAGGMVYELRVIYESGTGTVAYSLSVSYPN